jgi:hypothetical protein
MAELHTESYFGQGARIWLGLAAVFVVSVTPRLLYAAVDLLAKVDDALDVWDD